MLPKASVQPAALDRLLLVVVGSNWPNAALCQPSATDPLAAHHERQLRVDSGLSLKAQFDMTDVTSTYLNFFPRILGSTCSASRVPNASYSSAWYGSKGQTTQT